jgi:tetratricopeptide (TPR) repeat protein
LARVLLGALDAATTHLAPQHPHRLTVQLGYVEGFLSNEEDAKALELSQELCEVVERLPLGDATLEPHIKCPLLHATALANLGQLAEAKRALEPVLRRLHRADGLPLHLFLWAKRAIAKVQMKLGEQEEAEHTMRAALTVDLGRPKEEREEAGNILLRLDLAEVLVNGRGTQEARQVLEHLLPDARRVFGPEHGVTCDVYMQLSEAYLTLGMSAETEDLLRGAEILQKDLHDIENPDTLLLAHKQTVALARRGKYAEALPRLEQLVRAFTRLSGDSSENTLTMQSDRAFALCELRRFKESEALYRRLLHLDREQHGARHATTMCTQGMLACTLMHVSRFLQTRACACAGCALARAGLSVHAPAGLQTRACACAGCALARAGLSVHAPAGLQTRACACAGCALARALAPGVH